MPTVLKSGSLNLLEPSGSVQACNGIVLPLPGGPLPRRRSAKEVNVTSKHLEFQSFTPNARKYLQQLAGSYGDGYTGFKQTKRATVLLARATATSQILPQRTWTRIERGAPPQIKPKYQTLDTHGNNYYFLLIFLTLSAVLFFQP